MSSLRITTQPPMLRDQVSQVIRDAILSGDFKPGDRLVEKTLCSSIGVSRTSVREALRHLESEGIVTNIPKRGPVVTQVTYDEAEQLYEVREVIEGLAAKLFAERALPQEIKQLEASFARAKKLVKLGETKAYSEECSVLTDIVFKGCRNRIVFETITKLKARVAFLRSVSMSSPNRAQDSLKEFQSIVTAIVQRDGVRARAAWEFHVHCAKQAALILLRTESAAPEPRVVPTKRRT